MENKTTITIDRELWKELSMERIKHNLPEIQDVIKRLLNNEWSPEDEQ